MVFYCQSLLLARDRQFIKIQNNASKVEYAHLVVVAECVRAGGACQNLNGWMDIITVNKRVL